MARVGKVLPILLLDLAQIIYHYKSLILAQQSIFSLCSTLKAIVEQQTPVESPQYSVE